MTPDNPQDQPPLSFREQLQLQKLGLIGKTTGAKPKCPMKKVSDKRAKEVAAAKESGTDSEMDKFFEAMRKRMVGVCQCGCGRKSSKHEDDHYRASISHIFPKRTFKSIATNPLNWVERNFWDGCHAVLDNTSMDRWVNMADWDDIVEKFHQLAPLLAEEERKHKFYTHFEKLVYGN